MASAHEWLSLSFAPRRCPGRCPGTVPGARGDAGPGASTPPSGGKQRARPCHALPRSPSGPRKRKRNFKKLNSARRRQGIKVANRLGAQLTAWKQEGTWGQTDNDRARPPQHAARPPSTVSTAVLLCVPQASAPLSSSLRHSHLTAQSPRRTAEQGEWEPCWARTRSRCDSCRLRGHSRTPLSSARGAVAATSPCRAVTRP